MKIDKDLFLSILNQTVEENPLACRAALAVDKVEFSEEVQTLSVSLGKTSTLKINLEFVQKNCFTEKHVQSLLVHEFLHIALGHTMKFERMTLGLNVALDSVINSIIHRKLGAEYSSMMSNYYHSAEGIYRLLRPMDDSTRRVANMATINNSPVDPLEGIHASLYNGTALADDVLSIAQNLDSKAPHSPHPPIFIGDHSHEKIQEYTLDEEVSARLRSSLVCLDGQGIFRDACSTYPQSLRPTVLNPQVPYEWMASAHAVLKRLLVPDVSVGVTLRRESGHLLPVLNSRDRRGVLKSMWSPFVPEIEWRIPVLQRHSTVQIYLDVSASMNGVLSHLIRLLSAFGSYIRRPLWAFSTAVAEATIVDGRLITKTTGGTSLACVYEHLANTTPTHALVISDGYVEAEKPKIKSPSRIEALIPHDGHELIFTQIHGIPVTRLPLLARSPRNGPSP